MRAVPNIFLAVFFALFLIVNAALPAFAQTTTSFTYVQTEANVPHDFNTLVQGAIFSMLSSATCITAGVDLLTPSHQCLGVNPQTGAIGYSPQKGGLVGITANFVAFTFNIPIHTDMYTDYLAKNFHVFGEKSYAANIPSQGIGYTGLQPLLTLWAAFRNLAYLILVVVFLVVGFAIMLRVKIDPRTVMTIQNQIPKIIIGIILVTFSFAIAALLIDFMYVITYLIMHFIATAANDTELLKIDPVGSNPFGYGWGTFSGGLIGAPWSIATTIGGLVKDILVGNFVTHAVSFIISMFVSALSFNLVSLIGCIVSAFTSVVQIPSDWFFVGGAYSKISSVGDLGCQLAIDAVSGAVVAIVFLIILISVLVALWKLWLSLLKAYLMILFTIILGPLMILGAIIPGAKMGFGSWFKGLAANLAIFPVVVGVFVLSREISRAFDTSNGTQYFIPPLIGSFDNAGLASIISFATIMLLPAIPDQVLKMFKAESQLGSAVGQGLAVGLAMPMKGFKVGAHHLFRAPDIYRQTGPGEGLRFLLGDDPKGKRWRWWMRVQGYNPKGEGGDRLGALIRKDPATVRSGAQPGASSHGGGNG